MDVKMARMTPARTLCGRADAYRALPVTRRGPHPLDELVEETVRVGVVVVDDLAGQEAVLGCEVALDVGEAPDPGGVGVGQQQPGQSANGVPHEVQAPDLFGVQDTTGGSDEERPVDRGQV